MRANGCAESMASENASRIAAMRTASKNIDRRLDELRLAARLERAERMLGMGHYLDVVADSEALVVQHPVREDVWRQLIVALACGGRHAEALRAFQRFSSLLRDICGLEPSTRLRRLEHSILRGEPCSSIAAN